MISVRFDVVGDVRGRRGRTVSLWGVACASYVYRTRVWNTRLHRGEASNIFFRESARHFGKRAQCAHSSQLRGLSLKQQQRAEENKQAALERKRVREAQAAQREGGPREQLRRQAEAAAEANKQAETTEVEEV